MEKIYLKEIQRENNDTIYSFLLKCINQIDGYKNYGLFPKTYRDPEYTKMQCSFAHRSFDDIVLICKTYFKTSKKVIAKTLLKIIKENIGKHYTELGFLFCTTANKWVFHNSRLSAHTIFSIDENYVLSYHNSKDKLHFYGSGKHNMNDILKLMNS